MAQRVEEWRWQWPRQDDRIFINVVLYPGHLPRSHGVQGCEGRAKTMTGTVALALCAGYLAWVFVAWVQQLHTFIPADDKDYHRR